MNGSLADLTSRLDWGLFNYGAKIESVFPKFLYPNMVLGWTVTTKEGTNYEYGGTDLARVKNGSKVFSWHLDKVEHTNGNYMTVLYQKSQGEIYPLRIDYTGA